MAVQDGHGLLLSGLDLRLALVDGGAVDGLYVAGRDLKDDVFHAGGDVLFAFIGGHFREVVAGLLELLHLAGEVFIGGLEVDGVGVIKNNLSGGDKGLARRGNLADGRWTVLRGRGQEEERCGDESGIHGNSLSGRVNLMACAV